jgi:general secretion pathway protein G
MVMGDPPGKRDFRRVRQIRRAREGFTLPELAVAMCVCGILAAIAFPSYLVFVQRARVARATSDIAEMASVIDRYISNNDIPPPDLNTVAYDSLRDPWGQPYVYLSFTGLKGKGKMRKDKNLNPLNTRYDLYSMGADGQTRLPLTTPVSKDDVILAFDGSYIGVAADF